MIPHLTKIIAKPNIITYFYVQKKSRKRVKKMKTQVISVIQVTKLPKP